MFSHPSTSLRFASLMVLAGMNLSMFTPPGPTNWNESSLSSMRAPSSCGGVGVELSRGKKDVTCTEVTTEASKKATSNVRVIEEVIKEDGKADRINRFAEITTEAGCDPCNVTADRKFEQIVINSSDFNDIQNQIRAKITQMETEALKDVNEKIRRKNAQEACKEDANGKKLDKDEKFECKFDKIADMDEEEADKYFNKELKKELEEMAMSDDPALRAKALEKLGELDDADLSDSVKNRLKILTASSQQMDYLARQQQSANMDLERASRLTDNNPLKQQLINRAKFTMNQAETTIANQQQQMLMSSAATSAADLADMSKHFEKVNAQVQEVYASHPALAKTDVLKGNDNNNGVVNGQGRYDRGGNFIKDPQTTPPTVAANPPGQVQGIIPNDFQNNGVIRGNGFTGSGSRIPQLGSPVQNMGAQPVFQNGARVYDPNGQILSMP